MAASPVIPVGELTEVFGPAHDDAGEVVVERLYEPVASASVGIWRVRLGDRSAVLKLVAHSPGGSENWRSGPDPSHWYYWRREVLAYETGLLRSLPGRLRAPRCSRVATRPDGSIALWLEDLGDSTATDWSIERYGIAARHLGQTQGSFLTTTPLPHDDWLSRGWLHAYLGQRDGDFALLRDPSVRSDPRVTAHVPDSMADEAIALRQDQRLFLDVIDRMPKTLCHLDLHPANLFADGADATVAIDWSFVGIGAIGEDAGNLVPDAVLDFHVPPEQIDDLHHAIRDGYEVGLRDRGWSGARDTVTLAMSATIAAKYAWILPALVRAAIDDRALLNGRPFEQTLHWWIPTVRFIHERAEEARALAPHLR